MIWYHLGRIFFALISLVCVLTATYYAWHGEYAHAAFVMAVAIYIKPDPEYKS